MKTKLVHRCKSQRIEFDEVAGIVLSDWRSCHIRHKQDKVDREESSNFPILKINNAGYFLSFT
jgi:hypothetical protein